MTVPTLDALALETLVSAAVAAPSVHNTQPWRFRLVPETSMLEVRAAAERALPAVDPEGRALHVSVGAAVLNLRTAARHLGWAPEVRLLPDPAEPELLADVRLDESEACHLPAVEALYDAIWRRHSIRSPFTGPPVPAEVLAEFADVARAEDTELLFPDDAETERLLRLTAEAERRNTTDSDQRTETRSWVQEPGAPPYGIPVSALGPQDAGGHLPMRDFGALAPARHLAPVEFESQPRIAVLLTRGDRPVDWLRAGLALEHVLLAATVRQVRASLLHQAMEWRFLRWEARDPRHGPAFAQMLIRLGYGPEGAPTPRLPAADVLDG
ncbi:aromatic ring-opening dioxygenase LigA [Kitasatospora griseola]|uniref:Aromatic ring-opening dioxygenase LigA n=1 Tax=Kitasatospora griseola TaxID=2064 RepID=A0A0D0NDR9_KITGR|nr:aromatic ring-opening dioxygenase LigA [Kitasatospora griseola]KIQ66370.1 aromatic ring-opening dioxygenase LigA [Kitasatospora griseola]